MAKRGYATHISRRTSLFGNLWKQISLGLSSFRQWNFTRESTSDLQAPKTWEVQGWRGTVTLGATVSALILAANLALLIWAKLHQQSLKKSVDGNLIVYQESYSAVRTIYFWSHVIINVLSALLLGASNAAMQCISAPTRADVDEAHANGHWLHIGVIGFRNLKWIPPMRLTIWVMLLATSLPVHLIYNSVIVKQSSVTDWTAWIVPSEFLTLDTALIPYPDLQHIQTQISDFHKLNSSQCKLSFKSITEQTYNNAVLITNATRFWNYTQKWPIQEFDMAWMSNFSHPNPLLWEIGIANKTENVTVDYCLAQEWVVSPDSMSTISVNEVLLIIVIICNTLKLACFLYILSMQGFLPLVTIGDAIASFLAQEDPTTKGSSLLSVMDVRCGQWHPASKEPGRTVKGYTYGTWRSSLPSHWLFLSMSTRRWITTSLCLLSIWILTSAVLFSNLHRIRIAISDFGVAHPDKTVVSAQGGYMTKSVVVANLPQLIVSAAYFLYNSSLTCMLLTRECNNYAVQRKPLRVSRPEGVQRSTFWLQLPYRFGIPLMTASTILHLLVSQSFFAQSFSTHTSNGSVDNDRSVSGVLWSPTALLVTIIFSGVVLLFLMVICALEYSLFSVKVFMPISASCSAAISAACHRSVRDGTDAARLPLKYGVLSGQSNEGFRRLGFSSSEVEPLVDGEAYR